MSGKRVFTWREADRIEYLANFLLSAVGLATPVPRHEDVGVDFHCSLVDQEGSEITYGFPFMVQVRSIVKPVIRIKAPRKYRHQKNVIPDHLSWLFQQELPMFLALVDRDDISIHLYSLSPAWFVVHDHENCPDCSSLSLVPRTDQSNTAKVGRPKQIGQVTSSPESYEYEVDLGYPVASFSAEETAVRQTLAKQKESLRFCIDQGLRNLVFLRAGLPQFHWLSEARQDEGGPISEFFCREAPRTGEDLKHIYSFLGPSLVPLALRYKEDDRTDLLDALRSLFKEMPADTIPPEIRQALPEIFKKRP
jgi:hypothetical protein